MKTLAGMTETDYDPYQLLRAYTYYRLFLGALLLLTHETNLINNMLGSNGAPLFRYTCIFYILLNLLSLIFIWRNKSTPSVQQRFLAVFSDIVIIAVLMHASGGVTGGLGYLLLAAVAVAGMLLSAQLAIFSAALATIALISDSLLQFFAHGMTTNTLFVSGYLGILIFTTALTFQYITRKIRHSKAEVLNQQRHVAHLQKLARLIVERMRTGILVLNKDNNIELVNHAAKELLGFTQSIETSLTLRQMPELMAHLSQWQQQPSPENANFTLTGHGGSDVRLSMANLELGADSGTLIFVEDSRALTQQAQQLKLASLGRLTASIAHEIRNPLGAISHATQLLTESNQLKTADLRLLEIIDDHTKRVNQIIENIFQVSRRKTSEPQVLHLNTWLETFLKGYLQAHGSRPDIGKKIVFDCKTDNIVIRFDQSQLHQVLTNLLDNAIRYANFSTEEPAIALIACIDAVRQTPCLHVTDNGPGIDQSQQKHVFEPFFTTESSGSGLGLFLCKELCEANQAFISYIADEEHPSCFTIQFAHPEKSQ